jgi:ABC-type transporter MlaC component
MGRVEAAADQLFGLRAPGIGGQKLPPDRVRLWAVRCATAGWVAGVVLFAATPLATAQDRSLAPEKNAAAATTLIPETDQAAAKKKRSDHAAKKVDVEAKAKKTAAKKTERGAAAQKAAVKAQRNTVATKSGEAAKVAAAAAKAAPADKVAAASKAAASYTITTTRNGVTYTATRVVPLAEAYAAPRPVKLATALAATVAGPARRETPPPVAPAKLTKPPASSATAVKPATKSLETAAAASPLTKIVAVQRMRLSAVEEAVAPPMAAVSTAKAATAPTALPPLRTAPSGTTAEFVAGFLREAFRLARAPGTTALQRRGQLAALFSRTLDIPKIAGYTTADELNALPPEMQQRFRTVLISYLVETYYPRIELASDPSVTVEAVAARPLPDGTAIVTTTFTKSGWGSESVKWHLAAAGDGYRVVDIMSAGASLVQMERDTFHSVMRDGGVPALMARLDARTKALASAAP